MTLQLIYGFDKVGIILVEISKV